MKKMYSEQELKNILGQNLPESDLIDQKIQEAYTMIRETTPKRKNLHHMRITITAVAAALVLCFIFCTANPALAAQIPIIGRIFQLEEQKVSYPGDYSTKSKPLASPGTEAAAAENQVPEESLYCQTSGGVTFSISESYADSMSLYLAVSLEAEDGFPQTFLDVNEGWDLSYQVLEMDTVATADFGEAAPGRLTFDPALGVESPFIIEGNFLDSATFAGIIRVDLANLAGIDQAGNLQRPDLLPGHFTYGLKISDIYVIKPESAAYTNDPVQLEKISGNWDFSIDVTANDSEVITKEMNLANENGIGIGTVRRSPYEITADLICPEGESAGDYVVVMADARGQKLESRGPIVGTYSVWQRDVSKVTIAVCDEETYMNYKGDFDSLLSKALFQTEVELSR